MILKGAVLISYALDPSTMDGVLATLNQSMRAVRETDEVRPPWNSGEVRWVEKDPASRLAQFKKFLGGWNNPDQKPIFQQAVQGYSVTLQSGDLLPFKLLTVNFTIELEPESKAPNRPANLLYLTQSCREIAEKLTGMHGGETIVVTSQVVPRQELEALFQHLEGIGEPLDPPPGVQQSLPGASPLMTLPPAGLTGLGDGFSHVRMAQNLHVVLAPLSSSPLHGPGWIFHFYEEASRHPESDSGRWGTRALHLVDPAATGWTKFVEQRVTGMPLILATWSWLRSRKHDARQARKAMLAHEHRLRNLLLNPKTLSSWSSLKRWDDETRVRNHELRVLRDEYEMDLVAFTEGLRNRETWIEPPGRSLREQKPPPAGHLQRLLQEFLRELNQTIGVSEEAWELARAQKESYKVRLERLLGIAILVLATIQAMDFVIGPWTG